MTTRLPVVSPMRLAFFRRSSSGSMPSWSATRLMCSSTASETEVTPKPRMAVVGTRLVKSTNPSKRRLGIV